MFLESCREGIVFASMKGALTLAKGASKRVLLNYLLHMFVHHIWALYFLSSLWMLLISSDSSDAGVLRIYVIAFGTWWL